MTFLGDVDLAPEEGVIMRRTIAGRVIDLGELLFGRWALSVGPAGSQAYTAQYTFDSRRGSAFAQAEAISQMAAWDGETEPEGWVRAIVDGRPTRRRPEGDRTREERARVSAPRPVIDHAYRGSYESRAGWWLGLAYSPENVERIKALIPWPDRSWDALRKEWWLSIEYGAAFAEAFPAFGAYLKQAALPGF